jgi:23S rRNA pseudouridine1911/1915/1917 synthase
MSFLREKGYFNYLRPFGETTYDRGLLYRLDYETSGLLILSDDESFIGDLRKGSIKPTKKSYWAVVEGDYEGEEHLVHTLSTSGKRIISSQQGREANLNVQKVAYNSSEDMSVLKVELKEGLRHQIRAQLSFVGFPIVGDVLYGAKASLKGFGLHCRAYDIDSVSFTDDQFGLLENFSL